MFATLLISLREGIEAFLIVALTLSYLRKSSRSTLAPAVLWGTAVAIGLSVVAGYFFGEAENKPIWEGILALVAGVLVLSMVFYMSKAAKTMRADIAAKVDAAAARPGLGAWVGVFAFVLLMIVREGMETAAVLMALATQSGHGDMILGSAIGLCLAAMVAWAWTRYGQKINLRRFFQVTSMFLVLFTIQLFIYAFHEFSEAGALPFVDNEWWHIATEPYGPEGQFGQWLSYSMVLIPAVWLAYAWWQDRQSHRVSVARPA